MAARQDYEPEKDSRTPLATAYGYSPALNKRTHFKPTRPIAVASHSTPK